MEFQIFYRTACGKHNTLKYQKNTTQESGRVPTYVSTTLFCPESEENVKTPVDFSQLEVLSKYDVIIIG